MRNDDRVIVLGPCPCRCCGESVYWDGWGWRNLVRNAEHVCRRTKRDRHSQMDQTIAEWRARGAA